MTHQVRFMFGENSNTATQHLVDGTSNTIAISERTRWLIDGALTSAWGYRGWVQFGIDTAAYGINGFDVFLGDWYKGNRDTIRGRLAEWGTSGGLHPGGINVAAWAMPRSDFSHRRPIRRLRAPLAMAGSENVTMP